MRMLTVLLSVCLLWLPASECNPTRAIHQPTVPAGQPTIAAPGCLQEEDVDYYGSDIHLTWPWPTVSDPDACNELCIQNDDCTHWTFATNDNKCYLKNSDAGRVYSGRTISGPKCTRADESIYGVDGTCYVDDETRILEHWQNWPAVDETNTPSKCVTECGSLGYQLAGVQFSHQCFCGHQLAERARIAPRTDCNTPCSGDESVFCGGTWRMNVYSTRTSNTPGCLHEDNIDYYVYGSDIDPHSCHSCRPTVPDPAGCNNLCVETDACTHWTFNTLTWKCYLKNSDSGRIQSSYAISGPKCTTDAPPPPPASLVEGENISLVGGPNPHSGNVMVGGRPVCDDEWDEADAEVVCRQLGYDFGLDRVTIESEFGHVSSNFAMDNVFCFGEEGKLEDCRYIPDHDCSGGEGAGVVCLICPRTEFGCDSGQCIPNSSLCDGTEDCADGSDEKEDYCTRPGAPTMLQLVIEELVGGTYWSLLVPDDSDTDQDGQLSEREVEKKYQEYWNVAFNILDKDKDGAITSDEIRGLQLETSNLRDIWNLATESWPLKEYYQWGDVNENGFIDREDFNLLGYANHWVDCGPMWDIPNGVYGPMPELTTDEREACEEEGNMIWNKAGKYILIADKNQDGQVSLEEIRDKAASYIEPLLNLIDFNEDGKLSIKDLDSPKIARSDIITVVTEAFKAIDLNGDESLNLGTDVPYLGNRVSEGDLNEDGIMNLKDVYPLMDQMSYGGSLHLYIMAQLSRNIDKNQDGQVELGELVNFFNNLFSVVDQNDDDYVTKEDLFKILKDGGVPEDQVGTMKTGFQTMITFLTESFVRMADQVLKELDENRDQQISREELYGIRVDIFRGRGFYKFEFGQFPSHPWTLSDINILAILADILDNPIY